jgi:protein-tyrosine-phosphatase
MNLLFVCTGNVSRSFLAEMLLKNEAKRLQLKDIVVSSAGVSAFNGMMADPEMVNYLSQIGVPAEKFASRPITKEDVDRADLILVMEKPHLRIIEDQWPDAKGKVELLGRYIAPDGSEDNIIDPFGKSPYYYRLARSQITLAIKSLVKKLLSENKI